MEDYRTFMKKLFMAAASTLFLSLCLAGAQDTKAAAATGAADPAKLTEKAPDTFKAQFDTTKGKFTVEVTRSLSPNGADRFYNLVRSGFFKDVAFFRVIP